MNVRTVALLAIEPDRRALAGDQLFVDLDLSYGNIPPGTQLRIGDAVIEITEELHKGCHKFRARFGADALRFVSSADRARSSTSAASAPRSCSPARSAPATRSRRSR